MSRRPTFRPLIEDFVRFAGARLWSTAALMALGALVEGVGLLMIVPLAAFAIGRDSAVPDWLGALFSRVPVDSRFAAALALFLGAMAIRSLVLVARDVLRGKLQAEYEASLQWRAAEALATRGWPSAGRIGHAQVQSILHNDVPRAATATMFALDAALAAILLAVQLALVALLSFRLALVATLVLAPVFIGLRLLVPALSRSGEGLSASAAQATGAGQRLQAGLKAAVAQGTTPGFLAEYRTSLVKVSAALTGFARTLAVSRQASALASAVAAAVLLYLGAQVFALPFPVLAAALVLFARMSAPATSLVQSVQAAIVAAPSFAAIVDRLGPLGSGAGSHAIDAPPLDWSTIVLKDVSYRHDGDGGGVERASLSLARGHWLGIDGPSAAGKTTLADLVAGLLASQHGTIAVDGAVLAGPTLDRWRAGLAYVGQDGIVFDDSVAANLAADGSRVSAEAGWHVLTQVGLAARIRQLPKGLDEPLGQMGSVLSGGERQRLLIARALLRSPTLVILDEATAALDAAGEDEVVGALRALPSRPAVVVIAHRPGTLAHCDSVVAIQHGMLQQGKMPR